MHKLFDEEMLNGGLRCLNDQLASFCRCW